jgi:hypothetical protein
MSTAFVTRGKVVRQGYTNQLDLFGSMASDVAVELRIGALDDTVGRNEPTAWRKHRPEVVKDLARHRLSTRVLQSTELGLLHR